MKTHTTINEITHDDLVNLFSTAFYGSNYLQAEYTDRSLAKEGDCFEDILARNILSGGYIRVSDGYAEVDDEEYLRYAVAMNDIKKGLERAANGTFKHEKESEIEFARESFNALAYESLSFDLVMADALMQIILFDEIIY